MKDCLEFIIKNNLTRNEIKVLHSILEMKSNDQIPTVKEISKKLNIPISNISRTIKSLIGKKIIEKNQVNSLNLLLDEDGTNE